MLNRFFATASKGKKTAGNKAKPKKTAKVTVPYKPFEPIPFYESAIIKKVLSPFSSTSSGAYSIFIGSNHGTAKGDNAVEKMKSLSKEWKALSAEEKADYTALAKKETAVKLKRFESLPETGKLLLALVKLQKQAKKKAKTNEGKVDEKTGKPLSTSFKRILARSVSDEMREMRELLPSLKAPTARALLVKKGIIEFGGKPSTSDVEDAKEEVEKSKSDYAKKLEGLIFKD